MISFSKDIVRLPMTVYSLEKREKDALTATLFEEGSWLCKQKNKYLICSIISIATKPTQIHV